jgi:aspartyl-tRNA(Asn)/glutamyl-tRNA(Gln) amidotransferase subunit A
VLRLERAGAVAIGKTAMDPLAWSTHGQAPGHPPCLNPLDPRLSPGGSSSGSAVAVAAGLADIGLGTDVAGSVRVPAAYCGIVALKPGLGAIPLEGCLPLAPSFDLVGVMARSVKACATAYEALSGSHLDPDAPIARAAVLTDLMDEADDPVADLCRRAVRRLERSGLGLEPIVLRWRAEGFGLVLAVELARAWGEQADAEPERFPPQILRAIERARGVAPDRYGDAMGALSQVRRELGRRLGGHDVLLCPTVAHRVPTLEAEEVGSSTRFTRIFNALGWPALSVPCGHDEAGRPVSLQIASVRSVSSAVAAARMVESAVGS